MNFVGTKNFTLEGDPKLACSCGCGLLPDQDFMQRVQMVRDLVGVPLPVISGARCSTYNSKVSSTGASGPHTRRRAIDLGVSGELAYRVVKVASKCGMTGIGVSQKGPHGSRFVHLDDLPNGPGCPRPWIWSY